MLMGGSHWAVSTEKQPEDSMVLWYVRLRRINSANARAAVPKASKQTGFKDESWESARATVYVPSQNPRSLIGQGTKQLRRRTWIGAGLQWAVAYYPLWP
jgi:hypothetical protein